MPRLLLLVDSSIVDYTTLVTSVRDIVTPVVFNSRSDSYTDILGKIAAVSPTGTSYSTIGIAQHGSETSPLYRITRAESAALVGDSLMESPTMTSWAGIIAFFAGLKAAYNISTVDLISCMIYSNPAWVATLNQLETHTGLNFRASKDATGNLTNGGNWIMESDDINIGSLYFTDAIVEFAGTLIFSNRRKTNQMVTVANKYFDPMVSASNPVIGMTRVDQSGAVITWGDSYSGGTSVDVSAQLLNGVTAVAATYYAFAAIKSDGSVVTWGDPYSGANKTAVAAQLTSGVIAITANEAAFAALKSNGSVVTWGDSFYGGNSSSVSASLSSGVIAMATTSTAFAALKSDGSVVTWGDVDYGGNSSAVSASLTGVVALASNNYAFAALKSNGTVVTWGDSGNGGNSSAVAASLTGVIAIISTQFAFAAIKSNGSVVTWGSSANGGDSSSVSASLGSGVVAIASTISAFAALKSDGSVIVWGNSFAGGNSSAVASSLTNGVTGVASTSLAFAVRKSDGSVVTWGNSTYGGNSSAVSSQLTSGVVSIASNDNAFAAIKADGSVVTWGSSGYGGDSSAVAAQLSGGVVSIASTSYAFAALKANGGVVTWGSSDYGGNSSSVAANLSNRVLGILGNTSAFVAIRATVSPNVPCFPPGTRVLTDSGFRAVEDLRVGDRIVTADGRPVPVTRYSVKIPRVGRDMAPYLIPAHTFGRNSPPADIRLSPHHAFQVGKGYWQIPVEAAKSRPAIRQYGIGEPITYYHLELPNFFTDNIVLEGGAVVESYAAKQVPRGAKIYTYSPRLDAFTRPRTVENVIHKKA